MTMSTIAESYARGATDSPLLEQTIGDNFDRTVAAYGDRDALVEYSTGRRYTYTSLRTEVEALAHGLLRRGIGKGDRVGIWALNSAEWLQLQYATAKIGAILVCINPAYRTHEPADQHDVLQPGTCRPHLVDHGGVVRGPVRPGGHQQAHAGLAEHVLSRNGRPCPTAAGTRRCWPRRRWHWIRMTRSTSSTPRAPPATRRARPCRTTTSSTMRT
jgi:hypothetical protein